MNQILLQRICKLIAINYALDEDIISEQFDKVQSIDKVLEWIEEKKRSNFNSKRFS